jgi:hypothetical protein
MHITQLRGSRLADRGASRHLGRGRTSARRPLLLVCLAAVLGLIVHDDEFALLLLILAYALSWLPTAVHHVRRPGARR